MLSSVASAKALRAYCLRENSEFLRIFHDDHGLLGQQTRLHQLLKRRDRHTDTPIKTSRDREREKALKETPSRVLLRQRLLSALEEGGRFLITHSNHFCVRNFSVWRAYESQIKLDRMAFLERPPVVGQGISSSQKAQRREEKFRHAETKNSRTVGTLDVAQIHSRRLGRATQTRISNDEALSRPAFERGRWKGKRHLPCNSRQSCQPERRTMPPLRDSQRPGIRYRKRDPTLCSRTQPPPRFLPFGQERGEGSQPLSAPTEDPCDQKGLDSEASKTRPPSPEGVPRGRTSSPGSQPAREPTEELYCLLLFFTFDIIGLVVSTRGERRRTRLHFPPVTLREPHPLEGSPRGRIASARRNAFFSAEGLFATAASAALMSLEQKALAKSDATSGGAWGTASEKCSVVSRRRSPETTQPRLRAAAAGTGPSTRRP